MRALRHLIALPGAVARAFPPAAMSAIENAIRESEKLHDGEIRFAVEAALDPAQLWRGVSARSRAIELFAELGVWDTERNNGVLIYLLLAERAIEIVADRGLNGVVPAAEWAEIAASMQSAFQAGDFEAGLLRAVDAVDALLVRHFARAGDGDDVNELPDAPLVR